MKLIIAETLIWSIDEKDNKHRKRTVIVGNKSSLSYVWWGVKIYLPKWNKHLIIIIEISKELMQNTNHIDKF